MDRLTFINLIKDTAIKEYYRSNILPSVTIAQACLESGYGSSRLSAEFKNLFGVKAFSDWQGKKVILPTKEEYGGKVSTVNAWFKVYNSYEESIKDHTNLLLTSRYTPVRRGGDYIEQCKQLKLCGYATDSQYPSKLIAVILSNSLQKFDEQVKYIDLFDIQTKGILKKGELSARVGKLQTALNNIAYKLKVDNIYGLNTENAVKDFQYRHGLVDDGQVGKSTMDKITSILKEEKLL